MNPILEIRSVRIKDIHINLTEGTEVSYGSINKAKAHSREIGGFRAVRAFRNREAAKPFLKDWQKADEERLRIAAEKLAAEAAAESNKGEQK